ncbi:glycosyltransferase family 2 protein [Polaromonas eurypsychrophila]|uniref:Glycosyl transferase CsbB n=1 Tax=Polaromonas eurypsychrophila TaxID=1614635 RepID=A0A916SG75_9BURK|nr:glycosyltransferase family 2 protein [Polaromonas eurypsychrophila]GGA99259.1 glycosyl transferase CsbB [Polaromonas eurypsychrophila]
MTIDLSRPKLSVVVPAFNEAGGIAAFLEQLFAVLSDCCVDFEVWVIDDGSSDATWVRLCTEQSRYPQLHGLRFTRNFGKEAAILAGLRHARGDAVIVMDADGQHPPGLLPDLLKPWQSGCAKIVAAKKKRRNNDGWRARFNAHIFNKLMKSLTGLDLADASDFRLLDRLVVDTLLAFPEKVRFFRGMTVWTGFVTAQIDFEVPPRLVGESQWSTVQLTRFAITAMTAYSAKPLSLIFRFGLLGMLAAGLLLLQALYSWLAGTAISGWTSLTFILLLFGSANMLGIGVLGIYLAQLFDEIKRRPEFLVRETLGDVSNVAEPH